MLSRREVQRPVVLLAAAAAVLIGVGVWLFREVNDTSSDAVVVTTAPPSVPVAPVASSATAEAKSAPPVTRKGDWTAAMRPHPSGSDGGPRDRNSQPVSDPRPSPPPADDLPEKADPRWDAVLAEVNKSYDRGDYEEAKADAEKVLRKDPTNVRMLRVVVSSACITADPVEAQRWYEKLTDKRDRDQMRTRCERYQVSLTDPK